MTGKPDRIAALSDKLRRVADARKMATTEVWSDAWESFERELLERLLKCGPDDEMARWKLQNGIEAVRHVKRAVENAGAGAEALERELGFLEGRKPAPIA